MGLSHSPRIVTNGLVLCLDAGNTRSYPGSGTTWTDLSGGNNTGTLTNGPTFSSSNGGSIVFDGTNDYVNVPFNTSTFPSGTAARTLAAFFRPTSNKGQQVFGIGSNSGLGSRLGIYLLTSGELGFENAGNGKFITSFTYSLSTWYYAAVTFPSGGNLDSCLFYLNGVQRNLSTSGSGSTINTSTSACVIGSIPDAVVDATANFAGNIANVALYNRALSAAEIRQNFNATRGRYGI